MIIYTHNGNILKNINTNKWLVKPSSEVLYYDNTVYTITNTDWTDLAVCPKVTSKRWVVVMYDQSGEYIVIGAGAQYGHGFSLSDNSKWRAWLMPYNRPNLRTVLYGSQPPIYNISNQYVSSEITTGLPPWYETFYYNDGVLQWGTMKTYKYVIDTSTSTNNVRQYMNTDTLERSLMGSGPMNVNNISNIKVSAYCIPRINTNKEIISNIRIAQFDNEADALSYNGEQTV